MPLSAVRFGNRVLLTVPGEMTVELGRRLRAAALAALSGSGLGHVVVAGYANEYVSYLTTPEEYAAQHYEGGTTVYGPASGPFLTTALADLAGRLGRGAPAPPAYPFDPTRGLRPDGPAYPPGAPAGRITRQPRATARLHRAELRWRGGADGLDRPLDRAFVTVERLAAGGWTRVDDDRGLRILWRVDDDHPQQLGIPVLGRSAPRHLPGLVGGAALRRHRPLPLRGERHPLPPRLAPLRRRAVPRAAGGGPPAVRGIALRSSCAIRPRCRSAISRRDPGTHAVAPSACSLDGRARTMRIPRKRPRDGEAPGRRGPRGGAGPGIRTGT